MPPRLDRQFTLTDTIDGEEVLLPAAMPPPDAAVDSNRAAVVRGDVVPLFDCVRLLDALFSDSVRAFPTGRGRVL